MHDERPNLFFIFTDQQRLDTLACYGNHKIHMPNLNRLAEQSVVFEEPHCTQPVCTPSRGSLMTGLWPHAHGATNNNIPLRSDVPCLTEQFSDEARAAYYTAYMGKRHLDDEIFAQHGYSQWVAIEDSYIKHYNPERDRNERSQYHHFLTDTGFRPDPNTQVFDRGYACLLSERYSKPQFLGNEASRFIRDHQHRLWILTVNFLEPHGPFFSARDDQYDPAEVDLPDNFDAVPTEDQPSFLPQDGGNGGGQWRWWQEEGEGGRPQINRRPHGFSLRLIFRPRPC